MLLNWSVEAVEDAAESCFEVRLGSAGSWLGGGQDVGGWMQAGPGLRCRLRPVTRRLIELTKTLGLPEVTDENVRVWRRRVMAWSPGEAREITEAELVRHIGLRTDARAMSDAEFFLACVIRDESDEREHVENEVEGADAEAVGGAGGDVWRERWGPARW